MALKSHLFYFLRCRALTPIALFCTMSIPRIFSLASIPERFDNLQHIVPKILTQADVLHLHWVGYSEVPKVVWDSPKIMHHTWEKAGSEIRFFPYAQYPKAYFFPVDDDIDYPANYAETMICFMQQWNNRAVCCVHANNHKPFQQRDFYIQNRRVIHFAQAQSTPRRVYIPGCGTTCFYTPHVQLNMSSFTQSNMSDVIVACQLAKQQIPVVAIPRKQDWLKGLNEFNRRIFGHNPHRHIDTLLHQHRFNFALNRIRFYWQFEF